MPGLDMPKIDRIPIRVKDMKKFYQDEFKRASIAIDEAKEKLEGFSKLKICTPQNAQKIAELRFSIAIGMEYLDGLDRKIRDR